MNVDNINLLGENMNGRPKTHTHTEVLLVASNKVHASSTECRTKRYIQISNKSFENAANCEYLVMTLRDKNCIHKGIKWGLNTRNARHHLVEHHLSSLLLSKIVEINIKYRELKPCLLLVVRLPRSRKNLDLIRKLGTTTLEASTFLLTAVLQYSSLLNVNQPKALAVILKSRKYSTRCGELRRLRLPFSAYWRIPHFPPDYYKHPKGYVINERYHYPHLSKQNG
jgi:hypothetical protein